MLVLKKIAKFVSYWMALIVIAVAALALFCPQSCAWIKNSWVNVLLGIVMFGMGLTLRPRDFADVFKRPKYVLVGAVLQFTIMPLFLALLALFSSLLSYTIFVAMPWDMV